MVQPKPTDTASELPPVDERLVEPETRYEMLDGELIYVPPADGPHGSMHSRIAALVEAHTRPEFQVAVDMLTRTSRTSDVAPDVSVYPRAPDPVTGRRQLQHLAFEVVSTTTLRYAGRKAETLIARGVRRVFGIDVKRARALEWSGSPGAWQPVDVSTVIDDLVFAVPLPMDALVHAVTVDDTVARALISKHNPVIEDELARIREQGQRDGVAAALLDVLAARGIALDPAQRARILGEPDVGRLARWIARAARATSVADVFAE